MTRLIVAAGGGGDAVAAAMLDTALHGDDPALHGEKAERAGPAVILTYAWDRLLVDPVAGPRAPSDFTGLRELASGVLAVPATAAPVPPAGSTLPRLAAELPHTFVLIDASRGVEGVTAGIRDLVAHLAPESIDLLDVGGDILARGDEPTLQSPLADALTLAACSRIDAPVRLLVAGPGLDGEIPVDDLRPRLGERVLTFGPAQVAAADRVLEWHPSEAAAMLAATARGERGVCEVRGSGLQVPLSDGSPGVHEADLGAALHRNELARALLTSASLDEAERHSREICGYSEIDYERERSAAALRAESTAFELDRDAVLEGLDRFESAARARGVTHTSFRRITEVLGVPGSARLALRDLLIEARPEQYAAPLWRLRRPA
ncbi:DUF1152 domain-containing protein [Streptomyces sp. NPDC051776]|uniref:DUF1152 domain-containing protein n=1 Tax=Streptomyces sp. NPDC051776 TaxID=3155414 RepID=UPI003424C404